jgi:beta-N-acetylhexosaminidase
VLHAGTPLVLGSKLNLLQRLADVPLLVTADIEPGPLQNAMMTRFPPVMGIGATGDPRLAYEVGRITALEARAHGVHVTFAPVVDVNNNPDNPIINTRSYGEDPQRVGEFAIQHMRGLQEHGLLATAKHFPGHGNTSEDSHIELPILTFGRAAATGSRAGAVPRPDTRRPRRGHDRAHRVSRHHRRHHSGHAAPAADHRAAARGAGLPRRHLHRRAGHGRHRPELRQRPGSPHGAARGRGRAAAAAARDVPVIIDAIVAAVERGEIDERRVDTSVRRLLAVKHLLGLDRNRFIELDRIPERVATRSHTAVGSTSPSGP